MCFMSDTVLNGNPMAQPVITINTWPHKKCCVGVCVFVYTAEELLRRGNGCAQVAAAAV